MNRKNHFGIACIALVLLTAAGCQRATVSDVQAAAADHYVAGQICIESGNMETALEELGRAVQINPTMALAYGKMGEIYQSRGQLQDACKSYEKSVELDPKNGHDLVRLGDVYQLLNRLADAVSVYLRALTIQPNDYQAQFELGTLYYRQSKLADAEGAFNKCIKIDAGRPDAYAHLGVVYDAQGRYYDASRAWRESLEKNLDQPKVMLNLATVYLKQGRYILAAHVLTLARRSNSSDPQVHQNLGACYYQLALIEARQTSDKQADLPECLRYLELSRKSYRAALELDRNDAKTLSGLGATEMILARNVTDPAQRETYRTEAIECWHRSMEIQPNQPEVSSLLRDYAPPSHVTDMPR